VRSSASLNSASAPRRELLLPSHLALRHHRGSLVISQRLLGTREVMLVHHTKCGLHGVDDAALRAIRRRTSSVRSTHSTMRCAQPCERAQPSVSPARDRVRGFVYDVDSGRVREVVV
jgi:carbonic anhydrase